MAKQTWLQKKTRNLAKRGVKKPRKRALKQIRKHYAKKKGTPLPKKYWTKARRQKEAKKAGSERVFTQPVEPKPSIPKAGEGTMSHGTQTRVRAFNGNMKTAMRSSTAAKVDRGVTDAAGLTDHLRRTYGRTN